MTIELWAAFALASWILTVIPGPTVLTIVSYSISHGKPAVVPLVAATALGDSTALLLSILGLGALLATSAVAFTLVKWAGGLYLIYLGIAMFRSKQSADTNQFETIASETIAETTAETTAHSSPINDTPAKAVSLWKLFGNTRLITALNPKGMIFFLAFLPQFINSSIETAPQYWILSITFVSIATLNAIFYVAFAASARRVLSSPQAQKRFNIIGGNLLVIAGGWALSAKQAT